MNYKLLLPLILLLSAFPATAADRWFEVELLLFQRNVDLKDISESLTKDNIKLNLSKSIPLVKTQTAADCSQLQICLHQKNPVLIDSNLFDSENNHFQRLTNDQLQLSAQREQLRRHAAYTPILHLAWRMPVQNRYAAKPIHLFAGENFARAIQKNINDSTAVLIEDNDLGGENSSTTAMPSAADKWAIDGNFKVFLDHFLFIDSQLVIRQQVTQTVKTIATQQAQEIEVVSSENDLQVLKQNDLIEPIVMQQVTELKEVLFDQNRRLRSGEIHYFDHPLMGMIVQIRKIAGE